MMQCSATGLAKTYRSKSAKGDGLALGYIDLGKSKCPGNQESMREADLDDIAFALRIAITG